MFTLGLALSLLLMGAGVSVNATDFIIIGPGSTLGDRITVSGASGTQTVLNANKADNDTICIKDGTNYIPITGVEFPSVPITVTTPVSAIPSYPGAITQAVVDTILKPFKEGDKDLVSLNMGRNYTYETLDLSGFANLTTLIGANGSYAYLKDIGLKTLKLSGCKKLIKVDIAMDVALESFDITGCTSLDTLMCVGNERLTSLDLTGCPSIKVLAVCGCNKFTSLNLKGCSSLEQLFCYSNNKLASLDLAGCSSLYKLKCNGNKLTTLDVSETKVYIADDANLPDDFLQQAGSDIVVTVIADNPYVEDIEATATTGAFRIIRDEKYKFNIDWEIVDTDGKILSSKGNEKDELAIEVQGAATKGSDIKFSVRSNFVYTIDDISVVSYGYIGGSEEFHTVSFTGVAGDGSDKTGGEYNFMMPLGNVKITLRVNSEAVLPDPIVQRTVQIIANGIETSPKATAGFHYVAGHEDFTFTVHTTNNITVTTNRGDVVGNGLIISKNDDGSWNVTVRKVSTNLVITVTESTTESGETGNAAIAKDAVWTANGTLYVKSAAPGIMSIYNVTGQLCKQISVSGDATFTLPKGIYIVQLNGKAYKIKN